MTNDDPMDEISLQRIARDAKMQPPPYGSGIVDAVSRASDDIVTAIRADPRGNSVQERLHALGLKVAVDDQAMPISMLLGMMTARMLRMGLGRDAIGQVLYAVWEDRGEERVPELEQLGELRGQTYRMMRFAVEELVPLVDSTLKTAVPTLAWFLITLSLDAVQGIVVPS